MWVEFLNNPAGRRVGDCAVRAVSVALDTDWETAYDMMAQAGYNMADLPSSDAVWGAVLRQNGFYRTGITNSCPDCYTVRDFARDNPKGVFVLGTGKHAVTVKDGDYYDAWDSGDEIPVYVWFRR